MRPEEFRSSLHGAGPPANLPPLLTALWWESQGKFDRAHNIAPDVADEAGTGGPVRDDDEILAQVEAALQNKQERNPWSRSSRESFPAQSLRLDREANRAWMLKRRGIPVRRPFHSCPGVASFES